MKESITISTTDLQKIQGYDWFRNYKPGKGVIIQYGPVSKLLSESGADLTQPIFIGENTEGITTLTFELLPLYSCEDAD